MEITIINDHSETVYITKDEHIKLISELMNEGDIKHLIKVLDIADKSPSYHRDNPHFVFNNSIRFKLIQLLKSITESN